MGICFNKLYQADIKRLEQNVRDLITKLDDEKGKVHYYAIRQMSKALDFYFAQVTAHSEMGHLSKEKASMLKNRITEASKKLRLIPTMKYGYRSMQVADKAEWQEIKTYLYKIRKLLKNNKIERSEYDNILKTCTLFAQKLIIGCPSAVSEDEKNEIAVLILELFLRTPVIEITCVLEKITERLDDVLDDFEVVNLQHISGENVENLVDKLNKIKDKIDIIQHEMGKVSKKRSMKELLHEIIS